MELIDKNEIEFSPIEIYNFDEHKHEVTGMALFKDIEKIPTVKAIPLEKIKEFRNYITKVNDITLIQKLNELIESEEK